MLLDTLKKGTTMGNKKNIIANMVRVKSWDIK